MLCVFYSFFVYLVSTLIALWLEKMLDMILLFLNLLRLVLWPSKWSRECSMWTWKECVFCRFWVKYYIYIQTCVCVCVFILYIAIKSISCNVSFMAGVSLLIFLIYHLSIDVSEVLKSPTLVVLLSMSPFISVDVCFMYLGAPFLSSHIQSLCAFRFDVSLFYAALWVLFLYPFSHPVSFYWSI